MKGTGKNRHTMPEGSVERGRKESKNRIFCIFAKKIGFCKMLSKHAKYAKNMRIMSKLLDKIFKKLPFFTCKYKCGMID